MKKSSIFTMGLMTGMITSLTASYLMNKDVFDKKIKKTVNEAKKMVEKM